MSKHRTSHVTPAPAKKLAPGERLRHVLAAMLVALCVARPLLPSEAAAWLGDGQPFDMLWLSLAVITSLAALGRGGLRARCTPTDVAVAALIACCSASAVWAVFHASPRPAINMLWEWLALGLVYFLTRELIRSAAQRRTLVAVMIALAVGLACYGYYQYFVSMPADRSEYAQDPDAMLRRSGEWYAPGSTVRRQFENRLQSTEPLATFALTNSLAGYLAPWLVIAVGIGAGSLIGRPGAKRRTLVAWAVTVLLIGGCLLLTKSRSAYLATAVGLLLVPLSIPAVRQRLSRRLEPVREPPGKRGQSHFAPRTAQNWDSPRRFSARQFAISAAVLCGALVAAAIAVRGLDAAVLSEAGKSLGYRLEYWRSTLAMIRDYPWLGCGPGNFQDCYTQYKLPQASEEIQDPHNLFFEVWATAGTPAFLALVAVFGCFSWQCFRQGHAERLAPTADEAAGVRGTGLMTAGAAVGLLLACLIGPLVGLDFAISLAMAGLAVGALVLLGWAPWIRSGDLAPALAPLGVLVLVIHLLAAGGIGFPGVAYTLWILLALGVNQAAGAHQAAGEPVAASTAWGTVVALAVAGTGATACYLTAYGPGLRSTSAMYRVQSEASRDWRLHEVALIEASLADPLSPQPWQVLAELDFEQLLAHGVTEPRLSQFDRALDMMLKLRPRSSGAYRQAGAWLLRIFERTDNRHDAKRAIEYYRRAVELYPHSALGHADYAVALEATGDRESARRQATRARELDAEMPHADKKLPTELDERLSEVLAGE